MALIFLISKLFGLLSGMKFKEFFLLQHSRGKGKTLKGSFDFCCRFGLSVLARNEPEAPIKRQHHTQFFFLYILQFIFIFYKMDSLSTPSKAELCLYSLVFLKHSKWASMEFLVLYKSLRKPLGKPFATKGTCWNLQTTVIKSRKAKERRLIQ